MFAETLDIALRYDRVITELRLDELHTECTAGGQFFGLPVVGRIKRRIDAISKMHDTFVEDLLVTIMPMVETRYRIRPGRDHRAIAGLSMGGAETQRVAPSHLNLFSHIGVFSMGLQVGRDGGVNTDFEERNADFFADPAETNERLKLFYIASGENDTTVTDGPRRLSETLKRHGIEHIYNETPDGHVWINWRLYLRDFAPLLFRD